MSSLLRAKAINPVRRQLGQLRRETRRRTRPWSLKDAYINAVLKDRDDSVYVEIGVCDGDSFRAVSTDGSPESYASLDYPSLEENRASLLGLLAVGSAALHGLG